MDHRPYEDWLLSKEPLTPAMTRELQSHLKTCSSCTTLIEVDGVLDSATPVAPTPGFSQRFLVRLAAHQRMQRRRFFLGFVLLFFVVLGTLAWFAWPTLRTAVQDPAGLFISWLSTLASLWITLQALGEASSTLWRTITGFIPSYVLWLGLFSIAAGCMGWAVALMKFTKKRQGAQS